MNFSGLRKSMQERLETSDPGQNKEEEIDTRTDISENSAFSNIRASLANRMSKQALPLPGHVDPPAINKANQQVSAKSTLSLESVPENEPITLVRPFSKPPADDYESDAEDQQQKFSTARHHTVVLDYKPDDDVGMDGAYKFSLLTVCFKNPAMACWTCLCPGITLGQIYCQKFSIRQGIRYGLFLTFLMLFYYFSTIYVTFGPWYSTEEEKRESREVWHFWDLARTLDELFRHSWMLVIGFLGFVGFAVAVKLVYDLRIKIQIDRMIKSKKSDYYKILFCLPCYLCQAGMEYNIVCCGGDPEKGDPVEDNIDDAEIEKYKSRAATSFLKT